MNAGLNDRNFQEEEFPDLRKMSLATSTPVQVPQLQEALATLKTSPSKLTMLMQQVPLRATQN
jgi:hypothetical protein